MTRENRSFTRISLNIPASISLYQMESCHAGAIANISLSGCFFPCIGDLPVGEQCHLTITVGEGLETEKVTVTGMIVRSNSEGAGIKFTDTSPECRLQLEKIMSRETAKKLQAS